LADHPSVEELQQEIQRLQDEQRQLRQEHEALRKANHEGNGHTDQDGGRQTEKKDSQPDSKPEGGQKEEKPAQKPKRPLRRRARNFVARHPLGTLLGAVAAVLLSIGGIVLWNYLQSYESTDDAQIDGHLNPITPRISGTVVAVYVENNQYVSAGQSLVDLDPRDYQTALERAKGAYAQALGQLRAANPNVPIVQTTTQTSVSTGQADVIVAQKAIAAAEQEYQARRASLREAEAQNIKAQRDVERFETLVAKEEISRQQFDAYVAAARTQAAAVDAAKANVEVALRTLDQRRAQLVETETKLAEAERNGPRQVASRQADVQSLAANVIAAKAAADQALLDLTYTKIVAPVNGIVTNRTVEVGQHLQAGEEMLSLSQTDDIWVTANFKETQLKRMRAGQSADTRVDAFGTTYQGYVENLAGATGARTSLLPPENATGNYVKVVQRLPVRIRFKPGQDSQHRLRIGMSVEPKVWLHSNAQ